jgi:hypothetical protein
LRLCALDFKGNWIQYLPLVEFVPVAIKQPLVGHRIKRYMDVSVDCPCIRMKSEKDNYWNRK